MGSEPKGILRVLAWFDNVSDELKAVINDDGEMPVNVENFPTTLYTHIHSYDDSGWVKNPIVWGYTDTWRERKFTLNATVGDHTLIHSTVPAGEVWVLENISVFNVTTAINYIRIYIAPVTNSYIFKQFNSPVANTPDSYTGRFTLKEGDKIRVLFNGCVANDDIYSDVVGYKMKVSM